MKTKTFLSGLICICWLLAGGGIARAQTSLMNYGPKNYVRLEVNKIFFDDLDEVGFLTTANFINGQWAWNDRWAFMLEIPVSIADVFDESNVSIGNIQLGVKYFAPNGKGRAELSMGLPTADDEMGYGLINALADVTERFMTFNPDALPVRLAGVYTEVYDGGFTFLLRGGLEWAFLNSFPPDADLLIGFNSLYGFSGEKLRVVGGLSAIGVITEEDLDLSERFIETLLFNLELKYDKWRPGLIVRVPLDADLKDISNLTLGLSVAYLID